MIAKLNGEMNGIKWKEQLFWNPSDVSEFLSGLSTNQSLQAKVIHWEVKILVLYPEDNG